VTRAFSLTHKQVCSAVLAVVHGSLGALTITPIPALVVLGFGYALYSSAIWPSVAYVVPAKRLGAQWIPLGACPVWTRLFTLLDLPCEQDSRTERAPAPSTCR
jgi:hypothetical protein